MNENLKQIEKHFPQTTLLESFIDETYKSLQQHGFSAQNAIIGLIKCRDEICFPLEEMIRKTWGKDGSMIFDFSSLAGMVTAGKTGFMAAEHHSPIEKGREHYVFFAMPHIAITKAGVGKIGRRGRDGLSGACGALLAFLEEVQKKQVNLEMKLDDIEQSFIRNKLFNKEWYDRSPDIIEITKSAMKKINEDLEEMISRTVNTEMADYAVLTGVMIHGDDHQEFVCPSKKYVVKNGKMIEL